MFTFAKERFSRRALSRPTAAYYWWRFVSNRERTFRAVTTPHTHPESKRIARELTTEGIVVGASDRFLTASGCDALKGATERVLSAYHSDDVQAQVRAAAPATGRKKEFLIHLVSNEKRFTPDDPLLRLALDTKLLEIVSAHLGLWPRVHSIGAWLNYPTDAPSVSSQLWHRDPEDLRVVKVFIYLADVDERGGPFTFIPRTHALGAEARRTYKSDKAKRLSDDRMTQVFPIADWRVCTGRAGTLILADTTGYHRGGKPTAGHRILITLTYTSGTPVNGRSIRLVRRPAWISAPIQELALVGLRGQERE